MTGLALASPEGLRSLVDTMLDTMVDGVVTLDETGIIRSYNRACVALFGYAAYEVLGMHLGMLVQSRAHSSEPAHAERETDLARLIASNALLGRRKDGSVFPLELAVGATEQGHESTVVAVIRDLTERQEAEKEREQLRHAQKMDSLGKLTGGLAHDFNNLLAVILGNLDFMMERVGPEHSLREFLGPCIEAAEHGAELTRQLLAFSRKQALQPKIVFVNELLQHFTSMVRRTLSERMELVLALDAEVWNVAVDPSQLQNALLNLAVNARDAMPHGGKLVIETKNAVLDADYASRAHDVIPGDYAVVSVSDTGEGMTREVIERAFEPFYTTKEIGRGSGLGLSMVYGFVKQSRGHIQLYSEPGQGTTIKIYLPRAQGKPRIGIRRLPTVSHAPKSLRILVVEDNKEVLKLTSSMAESLGYEVVQAQDGEEALKILEKDQGIGLLLTDVMLPGAINGPALAKRALALHPQMKVLYNSGYAEHAIMQSGLLEAGVHLISKPFRKQQLALKLEEMLK